MDVYAVFGRGSGSVCAPVTCLLVIRDSAKDTFIQQGIRIFSSKLSVKRPDLFTETTRLCSRLSAIYKNRFKFKCIKRNVWIAHLQQKQRATAACRLSDIALASHGYLFPPKCRAARRFFFFFLTKGQGVMNAEHNVNYPFFLPSPRPEPFFCFVAADSRILLALLSPSSASPAGQHFSCGLARTAEGLPASRATRGPIASLFSLRLRTLTFHINLSYFTCRLQ